MKHNSTNKKIRILIENKMSHLLAEGVAVSDVTDAIENHKLVRFYYAGDKLTKEGWRVAELYAYGITKAGNPCVRAFQTEGETKTVVPAWKLFLLSKMSRLTIVGKFNKPREKFNPNGDKTMRNVIKIAKFDKRSLFTKIADKVKNFFSKS